MDDTARIPPNDAYGEALVSTDRSLRRLLRHVATANPSPSDDVERVITRARRQLRANQQLLGGSTEASTES